MNTLPITPTQPAKKLTVQKQVIRVLIQEEVQIPPVRCSIGC